jgi:hypothetical protein
VTFPSDVTAPFFSVIFTPRATIDLLYRERFMHVPSQRSVFIFSCTLHSFAGGRMRFIW